MFNDLNTWVSISDKSEGYCITSLNYSNGKYTKILSFNLLDDLVIWRTTIKDEIIIGTKVINNNVLVVCTDNIYFYNSNGKLMWKNDNYNKVKYFHIDEKSEELYILFEKDKKLELLNYNFDEKVNGIYNVPNDTKK